MDKFSLRELSQSALPPLNIFKRIRSCGTPLGSTVRVAATATGGKTSGVETCSSVWACPCCSQKISVRRTEELRQLARFAVDNGLHLSMITLTLRHNKSDELKKLLEALRGAWTRLRQSAFFRGMRKELGLVGYVRAVEITLGGNGWHPHYHLLLITQRKPTTLRQRLITAEAHGVWKVSLEAEGSSCAGVGLDWRFARNASEGLSTYLSKIGAEISSGRIKDARNGNMSVWQLVEKTPDSWKNAGLWTEYVYATKGLRQLIWSAGLKSLAGVDEVTDEMIAENADLDIEVGPKAYLSRSDYVFLKLTRRLSRLFDLMRVETAIVEIERRLCVRLHKTVEEAFAYEREQQGC